MQVFVQTLTGETIGVEVQKVATVVDFHQSIQDKAGLEPKWQNEADVVFGGIRLRTRKQVGDRYSAAARKARKRRAGADQELGLMLDALAGRPETDKLTLLERLVRQKEQVCQAKEALCGTYAQILGDAFHQVSGGSALATLRDYGVRDGSTLHLARPEMSVFVQTLTGKKMPFNINGSDTVEVLRERVQEAEGIPPGQQRLVFRGSQLEDGRALSDYRVTTGSVIHLILRLRGGMFHESSGRIGFDEMSPSIARASRLLARLDGAVDRLLIVEACAEEYERLLRHEPGFAAGRGDAALEDGVRQGDDLSDDMSCSEEEEEEDEDLP